LVKGIAARVATNPNLALNNFRFIFLKTLFGICQIIVARKYLPLKRGFKMILKNTSDFKKLKSATLRTLEKLPLSVTWMQTGTLIARCQGFKHEHNFKESFPIYIETNQANDLFRQELTLMLKDNSNQIFVDLFSFSEVIEENFSFPYIAGHQQAVVIEIFMNKGFISNPFIIHISQKDCADGRLRYFLVNVVRQDFYQKVITAIQPLVDRIQHGFEYYDGSRYLLSDDAKEAQEELDNFIENLIIDNSSEAPGENFVGAYELFNEEIPLLGDIQDEELTEIILDSTILLNQETTNLEIRKLVGKYYIEEFMSDEALYHELIEYRDECKMNYLNTL
jgi:hypothetical protein